MIKLFCWKFCQKKKIFSLAQIVLNQKQLALIWLCSLHRILCHYNIKLVLIENGKYLNRNLINYIIHTCGHVCSREIQVAMRIRIFDDKIYKVQK